MKKIDANGLVVSSSACVVYIASVILVLRVLVAKWGISGEPDTGHAEGILKYYAAISLTVFGGMMLVLILYRLHDLLKKPAPEWVFAAFGIVVPFAIYYGIPSFWQWFDCKNWRIEPAASGRKHAFAKMRTRLPLYPGKLPVRKIDLYFHLMTQSDRCFLVRHQTSFGTSAEVDTWRFDASSTF